MCKFIQIGTAGIATAHITNIDFGKDVYLFFDAQNGDEQAYRILRGEDRALFMDWWENEADVYVSSIPQVVACPGCLHGRKIGLDHLEDCTEYIPF